MHDSGQRRTTETGAQSDPSHANAAMELLSPYSLWQLSTWLGKGAEKYAPRNWEKGIPFSVCVGKLMRHLAEYEMGKTDEPHLDAIGFWWHALTHYEAMITLGKLPASLNDLPQYEKEFVCPVGWKIYPMPNDFDIDTGDCGWCIRKTNIWEFLHKDFTSHDQTGWNHNHKFGEAPGYWPTKQEAEAALVAYLEKTK
ncbi:hypothetical protein KAR91_78630 [Candidatus Pacearchaeota archaeon]|nr:hypothetical protein [Candidatus Pacearchaeota archaeon]